MVYRSENTHINDIESFWSYAEHILYNYCGVSKYNFPMYLKRSGASFSHRHDNLFKHLLYANKIRVKKRQV